MVPLIRGTEDPAQTLAGYASLYLREEVQTEGLVRRVGDFARFLESLAFSHAGVLNASEIARECEVNRKTVEGYLQILEDLLLGFRVYGQGTFAAIEVKNTRRVASRDTRTLREFAHDYPGVNTCLLYRGRDRLMVDGVLCLPCEEFLLAVDPTRPLPP